MRITCIESPDRIRSRPTCARKPGVTASCTQASPTTSALAKALLSAPAAASTAAVDDASAAVPAACASISRTTASEKSPPDSRVSRFDHGQRIYVALKIVARVCVGQDRDSSTTNSRPSTTTRSASAVSNAAASASGSGT